MSLNNSVNDPQGFEPGVHNDTIEIPELVDEDFVFCPVLIQLLDLVDYRTVALITKAAPSPAPWLNLLHKQLQDVQVAMLEARTRIWQRQNDTASDESSSEDDDEEEEDEIDDDEGIAGDIDRHDGRILYQNNTGDVNADNDGDVNERLI